MRLKSHFVPDMVELGFWQRFCQCHFDLVLRFVLSLSPTCKQDLDIHSHIHVHFLDALFWKISARTAFLLSQKPGSDSHKNFNRAGLCVDSC